MLMKSEVEIKQ
jgi:tetratricopeptide repeat protein 21B